MEGRDDAWLADDAALPPDPMPVLARWLDEAFADRLEPHPHAIALATVDPDGAPSARMVLCKRVELEQGAVVFYTHRESRKGRALAAHPRAALVFYWGPQDRQVRVEGPVLPTSDAEGDAYFATRPADAQLGAWASRQSEPIASRAALEERMAEVAARFGVETRGVAQAAVPRPPSWGGYRVVADAVELWRGRPGRIHDRALYRRTLAERDGRLVGGSWRVERLQP